MGRNRDRRVDVFGPAYLDRVVHVDRPLADPPLDQSVDGHWEFGPGLELVDAEARAIALEPPPGWPGPSGRVRLSRPILPGPPGSRREVVAISWHDDLGGMGAGYAGAFGGVLVSALGLVDDPASRDVAALLARAGIEHRPIRIPDRPADRTLMVTSGVHGDKLPIGFRGCHAALSSPPPSRDDCDLRVVAALPNPLAEAALRAPGAALRFFAPAMRNVLDRDRPIAAFADAIDVLACNRREWEQVERRDEVASRIPVVAVTEGPAGSTVHFRQTDGRPGEVRVSAFPRSRPPRDTNRAGEAYASTLITALLDRGWRGGPLEEADAAEAARRASAAAALVLDRLDFGFPDPDEVDAALRVGRVD